MKRIRTLGWHVRLLILDNLDVFEVKVPYQQHSIYKHTFDALLR
jgi:hypothetical protein